MKKTTNPFILLLLFGLFMSLGNVSGQSMLAAWTFDVLAGQPNTPTSVLAQFGEQVGTAGLYADGSNGSSTWLQATELNSFGGTTLNDPRPTPVAGQAYTLVAGTNFSANGKSVVIKFSMTGYQNPILTFATRGSSTGFNIHQWAWSTDGTNFTNFGDNTANTTSTWLTKTLDMSLINDLDGAAGVYLRLTVSGASSASGNNRLDNIVINAMPAGGSPTQLAITSVNGGASPSTNTVFPVVVQVRDNLGNPTVVTTDTDVTLTLATGTGTLGGTLTKTITVGNFTTTFTDITYNVAEGGVSITASATGLTPATSATFTVLPAADHLTFVNVPAMGSAGLALAAFTVEARRADNTVDLNFKSNITVGKETGPGNIGGTTTKQANNGVATFNNITFDQAGTYTMNCNSGSLTGDISGNIVIAPAPILTELVVPKYLGGKTASGTNNARAPFAVCLQIENLLPGTAYTIRVSLALTTDDPTVFGAGNVWNVTEFNSNNLVSYFSTDGTGNSGPFWVYIQPTGNSTRFGPGQVHNLRVGFVVSGGSVPSTPHFIGTKTLTALDIATTAMTPETTDDGAFIHGTADPGASGKYVLLYDNVDGTGDPLFSYMVRTAVPTNTTQSQLPVDINDVYMQAGTSIIGDYPAVIPIGANNPNGVRRIEARHADNTVSAYNTDDDGVWPSGGNTTTPARRDVVIITSTDAPLVNLKTLNLKVLLESLFNGVVMQEAQDEFGPHWGAGIADRIAVELHEELSPYNLVWEKTDVELTTAGTAVISLPAAHGGNYYIAVKHRNSIYTWSSTPVPFAASPISYDFSDAATKAFGDNQQTLGGGLYGIFGGDVNQDLVVDSNDMGDVDNDSNNFVMGYVATDANGDGVVDSNDMGLVDNNANSFVMAVTP